ncbi:ras-related protein Rap-1b [Entamoeba marina]
MQTREAKLVVLGGGGVGKSSIIIRAVQGIFLTGYDPYIDDSFRKVIDLDGEPVMLEILDTAGQEEFTALRDLYYRQGEGFIIVYSITSHNSFEEVSQIQEQIYRVKDISEGGYVPIIIVGNKIDLEGDRQVTTEEGEQLADDYGVDFIECSAKENINIIEIFETITSNVISDSLNENIKPISRTRGCLLC